MTLVSIHPLGSLDVIAREGDNEPSTSHAGAPLLEAEAVHAEGYLLGREVGVYIHSNELHNTGGGEKLTCLFPNGSAQVSEDEFLFHTWLLEVDVVGIEFSYLLGLEPVAEAFAIEGVGLGIEAVVGNGMGVG